ncbi:MAG: hypothetical protein COT73_09670 [Bdellovibrio sp. CG10_big_fil_rev_8_21_14_0_10_47_8]|nr:MAG: hypothetical protein COT73_09670 [Bdellovibrio sp. CG10_big_fil_rev_8_21_14_0_10_47_8]
MKTENSSPKEKTAELIRAAIITIQINQQAEQTALFFVGDESEKTKVRLVKKDLTKAYVKKHFIKMAERAKKLLQSSIPSFKRRRTNIDRIFTQCSVGTEARTQEEYIANLENQVKTYTDWSNGVDVSPGRNEQHAALKKFISLLVEARILNGLSVSITHNTATSKLTEGSYSGKVFEMFENYLKIVDYKVPNQTLGSVIYNAVVNQK